MFSLANDASSNAEPSEDFIVMFKKLSNSKTTDMSQGKFEGNCQVAFLILQLQLFEQSQNQLLFLENSFVVLPLSLCTRLSHRKVDLDYFLLQFFYISIKFQELLWLYFREEKDGKWKIKRNFRFSICFHENLFPTFFFIVKWFSSKAFFELFFRFSSNCKFIVLFHLQRHKDRF